MTHSVYDYLVTADASDLQRCDKSKILKLLLMPIYPYPTNEKVNKAYSILGLIKRNFPHLGKESLILLYKSMVRSHLEFSNSVWSPYTIGLIETLKKVQKELQKWYRLVADYHILID